LRGGARIRNFSSRTSRLKVRFKIASSRPRYVLNLSHERCADRPHIEDLWTQEPIPVDPNNPVYSSSSSAAHRDGKVRVDKEERRDGSPSSPFVSLLRRDVLENGHKVGSPAFFFVRIEEVDGKYVPWRGPPRVPPSHPSPSSPELSLRKRLIYYK